MYPKLCTRRVLTMEMLVGIPGFEARGTTPVRANLDEFAHRASNMYLNMIFRDGFSPMRTPIPETTCCCPTRWWVWSTAGWSGESTMSYENI